ncbi:MAG TPA: FtsX-like permease family protein [Firmicutes bacterium]|nr:FtsX-like permease family protein [Bacillota bacterium]
MNMREYVAVAWRALIGNKMRAFLTMLGVIIGVGCVIGLVSVGEGTRAQVSAQIQGLGSDLVMIMPAPGRGIRLKIEDAEDLKQRAPELSRVMPTSSFSMQVKYGTQTKDTTVQAVTQDFPDLRNFYPERGKFFTAEDVAARRKVCLIGKTVADELFGNTNPVGKDIVIMGQSFTVLGVMESKGTALGTNPDDTVLVPITTGMQLTRSRYIQSITAQIKPGYDAKATTDHITAIFEQKFRRSDQVRVFSQEELLNTVNQVTRTMSIMLGAIAGISLLVGGIGIMNIMLVSVTERTREIGIRKAIGARERDIMTQFLIESVILSAGGGLLGILLGMGLSQILARVAGWPSVVTVGSVLMAVGFSVAVGVFFGIYPASKAARQDPIAALRYE